MVSKLKHLSLLLLSAFTAIPACDIGDGCADDAASIFNCADAIDYKWEGTWIDDNTWVWAGGPLAWSTSHTRNEMPELHAEWRNVDWELGDVHYRRLGDGGSEGEWHTEILGGVVPGISHVNTPVVLGYPSDGSGGDATVVKTYYLDQVDLRNHTFTLHSNLEASQASFSRIWINEGNKLYRGSRAPATYSLSTANRAAIISTAAAVAQHNIEYTWADMLENKWDWWGNPDWDGTVGDIEQIRCDGVAEYAYETNGFRVWGHDGNWNAGSGDDDDLDDHNELWEHIFGYDLGELSPVIQAGCGGYGDGARTKMRERTAKNAPVIDNPEIVRLSAPEDPARYALWVSSIHDEESEKVYVTIQTYIENLNGWYHVSDNYGNNWVNREWTGGSTNPLYIDAQYGFGPFSPNQRWRITAIDQGGNSSMIELVAEPSLAASGFWKDFDFVAPNDGVYSFQLEDMQSGTDFDVYAYDHSHGGVLIASGTNGGNANDVVEFFAQKHTKVRMRVQSYSGAGIYDFRLVNFRRATMYKNHEYRVLESDNSYQQYAYNLPAANGWAIAWGNWSNGSNDVDFELYNSAGTYQGGGFSTKPTEHILGSFGADSYLQTYEYNPGYKAAYRIYKIE